MRDSAGRPNGVVFITDDITGRKATEEALRQAHPYEEPAYAAWKIL